MSDLGPRLHEALGKGALADALETSAAPFLERRAQDEAAARLDGAALRGLAAALAAQPEFARFLGHRPGLLERIAALEPGALEAREATLADDAADFEGLDLESALDALRLRRQEEMGYAACADLGDLAPLERVSGFLATLAETTTQIALTLAEASVRADDAGFAVIGMGRIAGREFTYHSDLDLIFLFRGGPERIDQASRIGQRLIAYLGTMTGAGIAYAVDTRLRPSGQQGMLVTSFDAFETYQRQAAEIWEHVALLRARAIAGELEAAVSVLERVRTHALARHENPWPYLADLRRRVEQERAQESAAIAFKTGPGGLMDADFLAAGGLLERGAHASIAIPSVGAMLRACAEGPEVETLLGHQRLLRRVEARARWTAGRGVEAVEREGPAAALVAALIEPGLDAAGLAECIEGARRPIRSAWDRVVAAETIGALGARPGADAQEGASSD